METVPADRAKEDTERVLKRHRPGKEPLVKEATLPPPPPNAVATSFAKLGHSTANETDMNAWSLSSMEENHAAITRAATELFYRQASRHRDMRTLITTQKEVVKEAKSFKAKAESVAEEMRAMAKAHITQLGEAEAKLSEAKKKLTEAEQGRSADLEQHVEFVETLRIRIASLEDKVKKASEDQEAAFKDGEAAGQGDFHEGFHEEDSRI